MKNVCTAIVLAAMGTVWGCAMDSTDGASNPENLGKVEQSWYSTWPFNQHGDMVDGAVSSANPYAATRGFSSSFWSASRMTDGNVDTDRIDDHLDYFKGLYGSRASSSNHSFLRNGIETGYHACINIRGDMKLATQAAIEAYWKKNNDRFQYTVGHVTHTMQDSFAPAHATRPDAWGNRYLSDICTGVDYTMPGVCKHPGGLFNASDDADDNVALATLSKNVTAEYLNAVVDQLSGYNAQAVDAFFDKWFSCTTLKTSAETIEVPRDVRVNINTFSNLCADVAGGAVDTNGTPVRTWTCNGTGSQDWIYKANGELRVAASAGISKCLGVGDAGMNSAAKVADCDGSSAQKWTFMDDGEIRNARGLCLDVAGGVSGTGVTLQTYYCNGTLAQKFVASTKSDQKVTLRQWGTNCLDIKGGSIYSGAEVWVWGCNKTIAQDWTLTPKRQLAAQANPAFCLSPVSSSSGAKLKLAPCTDIAIQKWTPRGDGTYHHSSGMCLDVAGGSMEPGGSPQLYACNGTAAQRWNTVSRDWVAPVVK